MPAKVIVRFSNTSSDDVRVVLEPWATEVTLEAGAMVDVVSSGVDGIMEVEHGDREVVFYGWTGSVLHLASKETELGPGAVVRK
jgi:hypothetical protein